VLKGPTVRSALFYRKGCLAAGAIGFVVEAMSESRAERTRK
jgi:hypothetical protein